MTPADTSAPAPAFAALIRTTAARPELLGDALQSVALQPNCLPVVMVHAGDAAQTAVQRLCVGSRAVVLAAGATGRRRGYPLNVGLEYCLTQRPEVEFVFFLDDDDVVYPFFTGTMAAAFHASGADVVYAASNRREPDRPAEPAYYPKPIHHVLRENFIPINSYAVRAAALRNSGLHFAEDLEYTEDWHFLLCMLHSGFRFHALPVTLSEFRTGSDGNLAQKRDPAQWKAISLELRRFINASWFPIPGPELVRLSASTASGTGAPDLVARLADQEATIAALRHQVWALENSLSWRWTAPVRSLVDTLTRAPRKPGA